MIRMNRAVTVPSDVLVRVVSGETVLLNLATEFYFGLDDVSTEFWQAIDSTDTLGDALAALCTIFDVEDSELERDYQSFVSDLLENGLLEYRTPQT